MKFTLRDAFWLLTLVSVMVGFVAKDYENRSLRSANEQLETELLSIRLIASHEGVELNQRPRQE